MSRLQKKYRQTIRKSLKDKLKKKNPFAVPKVKKVVINMGIGDIGTDKAKREKAVVAVTALSGQKPLLCRAKKAISDFGINKGDIIGLKVTLRGERMYHFLDKLFNLVLPQVQDFRGVKRTAFDNKANYTLGLKEQIIFPEVDYDKIDKVRGLEVSIITSTEDKKEAFELLSLLGMPFEKEQKNGK